MASATGPPVVYLLHYPRRGVHHGHYLGMAPDGEGSIRTDYTRHGAGWRGLAPGAATIADVWECESLTAAEALRATLARQGSRSRICSICSPGNARGSGGRWAGHDAAGAAGTAGADTRDQKGG